MSAEKVGRNEKCPCGSGRKFKHCCIGAAGLGGGGPLFASPGSLPTRSRLQDATDDLTRIVRWLESHPFVALDDAIQGALGILASELVCEISRENPLAGMKEVSANFRLFFGKSEGRLWSTLAPVVSRSLFSPSDASSPTGLFGFAESGQIQLAAGRPVPC